MFVAQSANCDCAEAQVWDVGSSSFFLKVKVKVEGKVKAAGFRPGWRHPFDLPLKRMQKPAELLLNLDSPTLSLFPFCFTDSACRPLDRQILQPSSLA
ncbi:hypothetical protein HTZ97_02035 [Desulfuromonas acetoxidans]|uniref:Uncharacterized protein n=1 Tax=Desulfuromonas acetoxidans (strain DSM 684 / 11070) TaxID=281689 RepID=Q1JXX3_DESA6|nr:hypothetical protein [Desulfuromonas acetoxidans]EAT15020.1 hypothetical protein Dace_1097 [Desulfuromonas acetoxidans DSM 684]MBF0646815.1 hypothetical protein [Desulfuromonas acetoxidans]NVD24947.1 hypothetical protein [Desulfuromonas acetoxidans]NVE15248.1 hypothetical protein [Desulfuromonas acetoxidans]